MRVSYVAWKRLYFGWLIVAAGFATNFMFTGLQAYAMQVFFKPMSQELGWSRSAFSAVQSVSVVVGALISPFIGPIIDRRGGRGTMFSGAAVAGAGFAALALIRNIWHFYLIRGMVVTLGTTCAGNLAVNVAIANWFVRKRGKAVSIGSMGMSSGGMILAPFAAYLILTYGWRTAWLILGAMVWLIVLPPVGLFVRRRPEDRGLLPDGDRAESREPGLDSRPSTLLAEVTWTRSEAMRTGALWMTVLAFGLGAMGTGAMAIHFFSFLTDIGISETAAAGALSVHAVSGIVSKGVWGVLVDKFGPRRCVMASSILGASAFASLVLLAVWPSVWLAYLLNVAYGLSVSGAPVIQDVLWASYFGRLSLGTVRSSAFPFTTTLGAVGPLLAGLVYDALHGYQFAFAFFAVSTASAAALIYFSHPPKKTV